MTEQTLPAPLRPAPLRMSARPIDARVRQGTRTDPDREPNDGTSRELGRRIRSRALILWPGLDRTRLARTAGDPQRVARLVEGRTSLTSERIVSMLMAGDRD